MEHKPVPVCMCVLVCLVCLFCIFLLGPLVMSLQESYTLLPPASFITA